jgi:excisionase family DNA binding protein
MTAITDLEKHPKNYVSIDQLADYVGVSRRTVYNHIDKGTLKAVKVGGSLRIPVEEAKRYVSTPAR